VAVTQINAQFRKGILMAQVHKLSPHQKHETTDVNNPATGQVRKTFDLLTAEEAEDIVNSAHKAFLQWRDTPIEQRAEIIHKIGQKLRDNKEELSKMMTEQMGKPLAQGGQEVELCAAICDYTADKDVARLQDETRAFEGGQGLISYQPLGVILGIQPWNFPLYQVVRYSIPNMLAGNTILLKHAEICYDAGERIEELYKEAGLPEGVFTNLMAGHETIGDLIANDKVRGVTLTGSAKAGKIIGEKAGAHLKKSVLELGGSDPYLILEDADLDLAVKTCVQGRIMNNGETCVAAKRFIVVEDVYDEFRDKFVAAMQDKVIGDPMDENTDIGPMAREDLRDKLHDQVQDSIKNGARCLCGGEIPDQDGYYYPPTVLENVKPGQPAYDDELFGPVASLIKVKDEEEAIRIANDHKYGLGGGIFSKDEKRAKAIARTKIDTGLVCVNGYFLAQPNLPFGGVKDSGYGREHGGFGVREFVNIKTVMIGDQE
jgi:succinate-semialdehyde dehydrogenase/glutarate-semialdehyde dehydrogenase